MSNGEKRYTPKDLKLRQYIEEHPGSGIGEIARANDFRNAGYVSRALRKLIGTGDLKNIEVKDGPFRGTYFWPAGQGPADAAELEKLRESEIVSRYLEKHKDLIKYISEHHGTETTEIARAFEYKETSPASLIEILKILADYGAIERVKATESNGRKFRYWPAGQKPADQELDAAAKEREVEEYRVRHQQVIEYIKTHPGDYVASIAEAVGRDPTNINDTLQKLTDEGILERVKYRDSEANTNKLAYWIKGEKPEGWGLDKPAIAEETFETPPQSTIFTMPGRRFDDEIDDLELTDDAKRAWRYGRSYQIERTEEKGGLAKKYVDVDTLAKGLGIEDAQTLVDELHKNRLLTKFKVTVSTSVEVGEGENKKIKKVKKPGEVYMFLPYAETAESDKGLDDFKAEHERRQREKPLDKIELDNDNKGLKRTAIYGDLRVGHQDLPWFFLEGLPGYFEAIDDSEKPARAINMGNALDGENYLNESQRTLMKDHPDLKDQLRLYGLIVDNFLNMPTIQVLSQEERAIIKEYAFKSLGNKTVFASHGLDTSSISAGMRHKLFTQEVLDRMQQLRDTLLPYMFMEGRLTKTSHETEWIRYSNPDTGVEYNSLEEALKDARETYEQDLINMPQLFAGEEPLTDEELVDRYLSQTPMSETDVLLPMYRDMLDSWPDMRAGTLKDGDFKAIYTERFKDFEVFDTIDYDSLKKIVSVRKDVQTEISDDRPTVVGRLDFEEGGVRVRGGYHTNSKTNKTSDKNTIELDSQLAVLDDTKYKAPHIVINKGTGRTKIDIDAGIMTIVAPGFMNSADIYDTDIIERVQQDPSHRNKYLERQIKRPSLLFIEGGGTEPYRWELVNERFLKKIAESNAKGEPEEKHRVMVLSDIHPGSPTHQGESFAKFLYLGLVEKRSDIIHWLGDIIHGWNYRSFPVEGERAFNGGAGRIRTDTQTQQFLGEVEPVLRAAPNLKRMKMLKGNHEEHTRFAETGAEYALRELEVLGESINGLRTASNGYIRAQVEALEAYRSEMELMIENRLVKKGAYDDVRRKIDRINEDIERAKQGERPELISELYTDVYLDRGPGRQPDWVPCANMLKDNISGYVTAGMHRWNDGGMQHRSGGVGGGVASAEHWLMGNGVYARDIDVMESGHYHHLHWAEFLDKLLFGNASFASVSNFELHKGLVSTVGGTILEFSNKRGPIIEYYPRQLLERYEPKDMWDLWGGKGNFDELLRDPLKARGKIRTI